MNVHDLQEAPRTVRVLAQARREINEPFERYRANEIDTWEPAPMRDEPFTLDRRMYPTWIPRPR